jgi:hypothetical protein
LHSYGLHLVSTYNYEIKNYLFDSISYLLDNHLSFLELRQNSHDTFKSMFIIEYKKNSTMSYLRIKSKFFGLICIKAWSQMNLNM